MSKFNERLRELRLEKSLSQNELAANLGMNHANISRWEKDKQEPTASNIIKLASYFNVTTDYILGVTDD